MTASTSPTSPIISVVLPVKARDPTPGLLCVALAAGLAAFCSDVASTSSDVADRTAGGRAARVLATRGRARIIDCLRAPAGGGAAGPDDGHAVTAHVGLRSR